MDSTISPYEAPVAEEYYVVDDSSSSYTQQKGIDYTSTQAKEYASGDTMPTPSTKSLTLGPSQSGSGNKKLKKNKNSDKNNFLKEFRIKINSKGYKVMDYDEISAIQKVYNNKSKKDYFIVCNNVLYKGCKGKVSKIYH